MSNPFSLLCSLFSPGSRLGATLQAYFRSGWAFLIPYLAAYLLYAWLRWPVNPANGGVEVASLSLREGANSWVPCLLYVYWTLHIVHLLLAALALRVWWKESALKLQLSTSTGAYNALPSTAHRLQSTGYRLLPWLCLTLVFWIPGIYLEWPSDPWEHLRRINEWHILDQVTTHSSWKKSSYFLPYSLSGHTTGLTQLSWLNLYYTAACLLLSWQYYRLARAVGLGERASFIFVLLNALTFGNNIFSFYRYYGLSSTIIAQLGAIALTRIVLAALSPSKHQIQGSGPQAYSLPSTRYSLLRFAGATVLLLPLISFNHIQGTGIAALGVLAAVIWRLIQWNRAWIVGLTGIAVVFSIAVVLWFPRHPALDTVYRPQGWLTAWYGLNFFSSESPAFGRSLQIVGFFGLLDLALGLWLIVRKNHIVGWLTLMPLLALCLPCFALPLAYFVTADHPADDILIFHRLLIAMPVALATVAALSHHWPVLRLAILGYSCVIASLFLWLTLSPSGRANNRSWHSIQIGPDDLNLRPLLSAWRHSQPAAAGPDNTLLITPPLGNRIHEAFTPQREWSGGRQIHDSFDARKLNRTLVWIHALSSLSARLQSVSPTGDVTFRIPPQTTRDFFELDAQPMAWFSDNNSPYELSSSTESPTISSVPGLAAHIFSRQLVPLDRNRRYQLAVTVQQSGNSHAANYLAVAWYDRNGNPLVSSTPAPEGAGNPLGWVNGYYSNFGLIAQPAPAIWTTYSISFGLGEQAEIPTKANFLRIGAILNYLNKPYAKVQFMKVQLRELPLPTHVVFSAPDFVTPTSLAAQLSEHWNPAKVHIDYAGTVELRTAAWSTAGQ